MMFGEGAGVSHDLGLASLRPDDQAPAGAQMTAVMAARLCDGARTLYRRMLSLNCSSMRWLWSNSCPTGPPMPPTCTHHMSRELVVSARVC